MIPSAIITADWHIRENAPVSRTDDYFEAQAKKIKFVKDLQGRHGGIPVLDAGDLLNREEDSSRRRPPPPWLLTFCIEHLPWIITVPGNHDMPSRSLDLLYKAGIVTLEAAGKIDILKDPDEPYGYSDDENTNIDVYGFPWGVEPTPRKSGKSNGKTVALVHYLVYKEKSLWPGMVADKAISFLKKMKGYDLIVTGHNHQPFVVEHEGRLLVNPGSLMRMHADQIDHKPRVYLWYAKDNTVEPVYLPIEQEVISREHIERVEERDNRLEAFVTRLKDDYEIGISFKNNLEGFFSKNNTRRSVEDMVWEAHNE